MDELDVVRAFRANAPEPDPGVRSAALAALHHEMADYPEETRLRRWRFPVVRILAPVSAAVAILVVLAVTSPLFGLREGSGNAAARELQSLASVAARQPTAVQLAPGQYIYTRSQNMQMSTRFDVNGGAAITTRDTFMREIWIGANGSGRIRQISQGPSSERNMDQQFGPGELTLPLNMNGFTEDELMSLAQHPDQLAQEIRSRASGTKNPVDQESFVMVGDFLRESDAPVQIRSALFQVAASIPGVELLGNVDDPAGRPGVSVAKTYNGIRSELIFDPQTSKLLAERQTIVARVPDLDLPVGTVIGETTYLSSGIVSSTTATP